MRRLLPFAQPHLAALLAASLAATATATAQSFHRREPNRYKATADDNVATALDAKLAAGALELAYEPDHGRVRALLRELGVPESSQTLVFSKTSLQRHRISPHNPRALYFGRDVYVGWIPGAKSMELAVADPRLGTAFYLVPNEPDVAPRIVRDDSCLSCHASPRTDDEPGLVLRSVFPDADGDPIQSAGETDVTFRTPLAERWGGWLVTGRFAGEHRGNGLAVRGERDQWSVPQRAAADLESLADTFAVHGYPTRHSDVGVLLVMEAQATVHNLLVKAALQMRHLLATDRALAERDGHPEHGTLRDQTRRVADGLCQQITAALLLDGEPSLVGLQIAAEPTFARDYAALWPIDSRGVRLGEPDLRTRTFVLPLSPMVHSAAFRALPDELRFAVLHRLDRCLVRGVFPGRVSMTAAERTTLRQHLAETASHWPGQPLPDLPPR
ncbi:MAG: hypothetical protein R3F29_10495 [Planctomycetota bacterium]